MPGGETLARHQVSADVLADGRVRAAPSFNGSDPVRPGGHAYFRTEEPER